MVTGGNESVARMVDCISGYVTVQLVVRIYTLTQPTLTQTFVVAQGMYPTLMLVVLRESIWNASDDSNTYSAIFATRHFSLDDGCSASVNDVEGDQPATRQLYSFRDSTGEGIQLKRSVYPQ